MATVTCPGCLERDQRIAALERRVAELEALVRDLNARLGANATNSGTPPSANPPGAPKPVTKTRTGKKPGGQPGHPPHLKRRLPPERLHEVIPFVPSHCDRCQEPLPSHPGRTTPSRPGIRSRSCPSWRRGHRIPGALSYLPLLWPTQPRPHPAGSSRPTASAPAWPPPWLTSPAATAPATAAWRRSPRTSSTCPSPWGPWRTCARK